MNQNFFDEVYNCAIEAKENVFLETLTGKQYSYQDLIDITGKIGSFLKDLGVSPGDRVAVQAEKSAECFLIYLGVMRMGAIYLPLNISYTAREVKYFLTDAEPSLLICSVQKKQENSSSINKWVRLGALTLEEDGSGEFYSSAMKSSSDCQICEKEPDDIAIIMYTSGTTGQPKGSMLTHKNLITNARSLTSLWKFVRTDVLLHALPIFHAHGLFISTHCALLSQSKIIFLSKFDLQAVVEKLPQATVMMGVPTFYTRLIDSPKFNRALINNMRLFISGSAPLLEETSQRFTEITGHVILERYGMTESAIISSNPYFEKRKYGSVGKAIEGVEIRITNDDGKILSADDIGHIQIKGSAIMKGYWRKEDKTKAEYTEDGWFRTGDLGKLDADDYLYISGRHKDLIISGGYNVYPKEVETIIDELEGVVESAVVGLPHHDFGEAVTAVVIIEPDSTLTENKIISAVKKVAASYKIPKRVIFLELLPRNAMGKVVKASIREKYLSLYS